MSTPNAVTFRDARAADVPAIVGLYADDVLGAAREQAADPLPQSYWDAFREVDEDPRTRLVVGVMAEDGVEVVVATLQLMFLTHLTFGGSTRAQVEAVRVASSRRGGGIGRALIEWVTEEARARGCRLVQLTTDAQRPDARRFYESLGFVASHVGMKLRLDQPAPSN